MTKNQKSRTCVVCYGGVATLWDRYGNGLCGQSHQREWESQVITDELRLAAKAKHQPQPADVGTGWCEECGACEDGCKCPPGKGARHVRKETGKWPSQGGRLNTPRVLEPPTGVDFGASPSVSAPLYSDEVQDIATPVLQSFEEKAKAILQEMDDGIRQATKSLLGKPITSEVLEQTKAAVVDLYRRPCGCKGHDPSSFEHVAHCPHRPPGL